MLNCVWNIFDLEYWMIKNNTIMIITITMIMKQQPITMIMKQQPNTQTLIVLNMGNTITTAITK